jgi:hypothetical protein
VSERTANLLGGLCGLASIVAFVVGFGVLVATTPHAGASAADVAEFLQSSAGRVWTGAVIGLLGIPLYLVFAVRVWALLGAAEGRGAWVSMAALAGALTGTAVVLAGDLSEAGAAFYAGRRGLSPQVAGALFDVREFAEVVFKAPTLVFYTGVAVVVLRTRVFPRWLGWAAAVVAVIMLASLPLGPADAGEIGNFAGALWMVAASVLLIRRREQLSAV